MGQAAQEQMARLARLAPVPQMRYIEFADLVDESGQPVDEGLVSGLVISIERVGLLNPPGAVFRNDVEMPTKAFAMEVLFSSAAVTGSKHCVGLAYGGQFPRPGRE